jgi:hypothetical protein
MVSALAPGLLLSWSWTMRCTRQDDHLRLLTTLLLGTLLACSGTGRTASGVGGVDGDAATDGGASADVFAGGTSDALPSTSGEPLPIDPSGACPLPGSFPRGTFLLAPQDMDAVVPMPPNEAAMYIIEQPGLTIDASVIELAASRLTLQPWPDGPPIAVTQSIERPDGVDTRTRIMLRPKADLPAGWFVLRIADPPPELTRFPAWDVHPYGPRGLETRFHTDTRPVLSWVRICNRGGGSMIFHVEHSQNVRWSTALEGLFALRQADASPACVVRDASGPGEKERIQIECTSVSETSPITLETRTGLFSLDGVAVPASTHVFTLGPLPRVGSMMVYQADPS